jgi:hypothetical protein
LNQTFKKNSFKIITFDIFRTKREKKKLKAATRKIKEISRSNGKQFLTFVSFVDDKAQLQL